MAGKRRVTRVYCPICLGAENPIRITMVILHIAQSGPLDESQHEAMPAPYWRYRCPACRFAEAHPKPFYEGMS